MTKKSTSHEKPPRRKTKVEPIETIKTADGLAVFCSFTKLVPVKDLKPDPENWNEHPAEQLEMAAKIFERGIRRPIRVSSRSGLITVGHGALQTALHKGWTEWPVEIQHYATRADEIADLTADNQLGKKAHTNQDKLAAILQQITGELEISIAGVTDEEFAAMIARVEAKAAGEVDTEAEAQIDKAAELNQKWQVKLGDLFEIGCHRLICGDTTDPATWKKLMAGESASLIVTDPPYGVSYADKNDFLNAMDKGNRNQKKIANDHGDINDIADKIWSPAFTNLHTHAAPGCSIYVFMPQGGDQMMMMMMMKASFPPKHELIWVKNNHVLGRTDYAYKHEPIVYAWKKGGHKFYGGFQTSILECKRPQKSELHPTMKPVELIERLIENSSREGEIVLDAFLGSGTTMLASHAKGRKCRGVELDPDYCAVILERMQAADPTLIIKKL